MKVDFFNPIVPRKAARNEAEKICRIITSEFPSISSTKICEFPAAKTTPKYANFAKLIFSRIKTLVRNPSWENFHQQGNDEVDFYTTLVNAIKQHRIGNCGDMSKLCTLIANINNIPAKKAEMFTTRNGVLGTAVDHAIQIVPINGQKVEWAPLSKMKNLLIIDPWLGFADFAPKYEQKIKTGYDKFFGLTEDTSLYLNPNSGSEPKITQKVVNYFQENFPQFIIKNK